ncbi:hypothetical protein CB1_000258001 [Camelus ferus]|nr:hypothetical protein CB1_000258001 [Camelus ferus]
MVGKGVWLGKGPCGLCRWSASILFSTGFTGSKDVLQESDCCPPKYQQGFVRTTRVSEPVPSSPAQPALDPPPPDGFPIGSVFGSHVHISGDKSTKNRRRKRLFMVTPWKAGTFSQTHQSHTF